MTKKIAKCDCPASHRDADPMPIGVALAEIAEIAGIAGMAVCPASRRDADPIPIGVTLAGIAEIAGSLRPALRRDANPSRLA
jgi:hypothetical protein